MNINFEWVNLESLDSTKLEKYCSEEKEVKFCWWIEGDLTGDSDSYNEVVELIQTGKALNQNQWRGNQYWLSLYEGNVKLTDPINTKEYLYTKEEFLAAMQKWKIAKT